MSRRVTPVMGLFGAVCLVLTCLNHFRYFERIPEHDPARKAAGTTAVVTGQIVSGPQKRLGKTVCVLKASSVNEEPVQGRVLVEYYGDQDFPACAWDQVALAGTLSTLTADHQARFDRKKFLASQKIYSVVFVSDPRHVQIVARNRAPWYRDWPEKLRQNMLDIFHKYLDPQEVAVLSGITLGEKPYLFPELGRLFKNAGVMHILVASGSNIWFVLGLWLWVVKWLGLPRPWALGLGLVVGLFYVFMAGAEAPVVRAYIMALAMIAGVLLDRGFNPWHSLSLAGLLIFFWDPRSLFQAGFQMSFLATAAIVGGVPLWQALLPPKIKSRSLWWHGVTRIFMATVAAQVALAPLMLYYFQSFSLAGFVANLFVVPLAGAGLAFGFLLYISEHLLWPWVSGFVAWITRQLLELLLFLAELFGTQSWSLWSFPPISLPVLTSAYGILLALFFFLKRRAKEPAISLS